MEITCCEMFLHRIFGLRRAIRRLFGLVQVAGLFQSRGKSLAGRRVGIIFIRPNRRTCSRVAICHFILKL